MSTAAPTRRQIMSWRNAVFVIFMLPGLAMASWVSRLPAVRDSLDIRIDQVGLLLFAVAVGSIVGLLASSHAIARFGARRVIFAVTLTYGAGLIVAGLGVSTTTFALVVAGLFTFGACTGMTDVAMNVSGAANERALGKAIMPIFHAFFSFGTMIGAGLGALAEVLSVPIVVHLTVIAALIIATMIPAVHFLQPENGDLEDHADAAATSSWRSRLAIWRDPRTLLIGVIVLGAAFAEGSANDWLAIAMVDGHGVPNETGALVFGLFVTAMTIGRLGGVVLINRFGRVVMLRASFALASAALLVIIFVPVPWIAGVAAVLWGLGAALGFPIGMSAAGDDARNAAARVSAVATIGYFAFLVGPPVIGFLGESVGVLNALLVVLVLCAIGIFVSGAAREPRAAASAPGADAAGAGATHTGATATPYGPATPPTPIDTMVDPLDAPR